MFPNTYSNDPYYRYYAKPLNPQSPTNRYSAYKSNHPPDQSKYLSNIPLQYSLMLSRLGQMKRTDLGWDGVKLKQYVTEQVGQDYLQNQRMLDRFRKEGEENRKKKWRSHTKGHQRQITSPIQQIPQPTPRYEVNPQTYDQISVQDVGINTNLLPRKVPDNAKYLNLKGKYKKLKEKYKASAKKQQTPKVNLKPLEDELDELSIRLQKTNTMIKEALSQQDRQNQRIKKLEDRMDKFEENEKVKKVQQKKKATFRIKTQMPKEQLSETEESAASLRKPKIIYTLNKNANSILSGNNMNKYNILNRKSIFSKTTEQ